MPHAIADATKTRVIFDTDCVLCSAMVHFILLRERAPTILFVSAWSPTGLRLASKHGLTRADLNDTFLVLENGSGLIKSDGAIAILRHLRAPWSWGQGIRVVPRGLRDGLYMLIARRRYRWFGKKTNCFLPPAQMRARFIDT